MSPDEAAVFTVLAQNRKRGLKVIGIATELRWYRESTIQEFKRNTNHYRVIKALRKLKDKGLVSETMTGSGSRYKLSG